MILSLFLLFIQERQPYFLWEGGGSLSFSSDYPVVVQLLCCGDEDADDGEGVRGELRPGGVLCMCVCVCVCVCVRAHGCVCV